ncbi:MAG TPA: aldehyde dehydrogenase [Acidimicrobiales bacterium]|jgi:aldehyde dehydrogenase (NAD+)|nr:aldehyde dehydrogenase [Acidimicrobiales bacterium]
MEIKDTLYIGGEWVAPAGTATIEVVSPATEEVIARTPEASEGDVDRAVEAARAALDGPYPRLSPEERAEYIAKLSQAVQARSQELADTITAEMGSPASWSLMGQVLSASMVLDGWADLARTFTFEEIRPGALGPVLVRKEPVGVSAGIIPWNVPLFIVALKLGAALAAGSPMILKPSPETPLDAYILGEILDEIELPKGMVSILPAGREVGEYLVRHPGVDKVAFTGSTAAGRRVGAICGEHLKRCTLELGGKSAAIILDDADLEAIMPMLMGTALMNNGQACIAQTRILASRDRYDEVVDALRDAVAATTVGDPTDPSVAVGPLVAERQRDRVLGYIEKGREEGAKVAVGGGRPEGLDKGWYVEPTLFVDVDNRMTIAREEIFGPVLAVLPYEDVDEAVRIANDSDYGLSGSVWTSDVEAGIEVAKRVRTGTYGVNQFGTLDMRNPFGGYKASGVGRELGPEGLSAYLETKSIVLPGDYTPPS